MLQCPLNAQFPAGPGTGVASVDVAEYVIRHLKHSEAWRSGPEFAASVAVTVVTNEGDSVPVHPLCLAHYSVIFSPNCFFYMRWVQFPGLLFPGLCWVLSSFFDHYIINWQSLRTSNCSGQRGLSSALPVRRTVSQGRGVGAAVYSKFPGLHSHTITLNIISMVFKLRNC